MDGIVESIDPKLRLVTVKYRSGATDVFEYGDIHGEASGMTINHAIVVAEGLHPGQRVKKGDIITYHKDFFHFDPVNKQLAWCHGTPALVAVLAKDVTLEDSNLITESFAKKLGFESIYTREIQITNDMVIDEFADVGSKVAYNDSLIRLKYEDTADIIGSVDEVFDDLKQVEYRSKHEGEVVGIHVYHVAETLNASLTNFINRVTYRARRKANATKGTLKEEKFSTVTRIPAGTRVKGIQLDESDVLIIFSIKTQVSCGIGDKVVFAGQLKSVIGRVEKFPITTEDGREVDAIFGANSIFDRIVLSVFLQGISNTILEHAEKKVLDMYFNE